MARFLSSPDLSPPADTAILFPSASETGAHRRVGMLFAQKVPEGPQPWPRQSTQARAVTLLQGPCLVQQQLSGHPSHQHPCKAEPRWRGMLSPGHPPVSCSQTAAPLEKNLPNLVCIINTSFPIQGLAQDSRVLRNDPSPVLSGSEP